MAEPQRNVDSTHRQISQPKIEKALRRNLYELQRLAVFYHKRGNVEQARELYQMMISAPANRLRTSGGTGQRTGSDRPGQQPDW